MRIGLISDTRVRRGEDVPQEVVQALKGVDLILHVGGINTSEVLDWLEQIAPVKAVGRRLFSGNEREGERGRGGAELENDTRVAGQQILQLEGHTIGVVNNLELDGFNDDILPGVIEAHRLPDGSVPMLVEEFFGTPVEIVVFGRTLYAMVEEHQGVLFINPGSPTLPMNLRKLGNVAILHLTQESHEARIIDLAKHLVI
jgi:putative phosphoesterase